MRLLIEEIDDYGKRAIAVRYLGTEAEQAEEAESERKLREGIPQDDAELQRIEARIQRRSATIYID